MDKTEKDLNDFLSKVDDINTIIKGLNSEDEPRQKEYMAKADSILGTKSLAKNSKKVPPRENTGINHSVINQKAFDEWDSSTPAEPVPSAMSQDSFMSAMEADITKRNKNRQERQYEATRLKELGNVEFRNGDYEKAVEFYSLALNQFRDSTVLWTNRAQAYCRLGKYEETLSDCEWALRVFENCLKAYIIQGKAYLGMKRFDEAQSSFEHAMQLQPQQKKSIQNYLDDVARAREATNAETTANSLIEAGELEALGLVELMTRLNKADQLPIYYAGGYGIIASGLCDTDSRTLFRTNGGLELSVKHPVISKLFPSCISSMNKEQLELIASALTCITAACEGNDENSVHVLDANQLPEQLLVFIQCTLERASTIQREALSLLLAISQYAAARKVICTSFNIISLCSALFAVLETRPKCAYIAASILNNLALEKSFRNKLYGAIEETVLPVFDKLILGGCTQMDILATVITAMTNLSSDECIRNIFMSHRSTWKALYEALKKYSTPLDISKRMACVEVLGLLMNMTLEKSDSLLELEVDNSNVLLITALSELCVPLLYSEDGKTLELAVGLLSHLLPKSSDAVDSCVSHQVITPLLKLLKCESDVVVSAAVKSMVSCTLASPTACTSILELKGLGALVNLLKHQKEAIFGNAALCVSHLLESSGKVAGRLASTNIIQHLLVLARDGRRPEVQHNCAILIAKLTRGDQRHLERLRELHGVEILVDVMRHVKE